MKIIKRLAAVFLCTLMAMNIANAKSYRWDVKTNFLNVQSSHDAGVNQEVFRELIAERLRSLKIIPIFTRKPSAPVWMEMEAHYVYVSSLHGARFITLVYGLRDAKGRELCDVVQTTWSVAPDGQQVVQQAISDTVLEFIHSCIAPGA